MRHIRSERAGVVLDVVIAVGLLVLAAFALDRLGVSLPEIVSGVRHFIRG